MKNSTITNKLTVESQTNWDRVNAMTDDQIDLSDIPEITPEMWAKGVTKNGGIPISSNKERLDMRVDADVLEWFKAQGRGYQTRINEVLREYVKAHKQVKSAKHRISS